MPKNRTNFGLFALIVVLVAASSAPVRAEFFGCKDDRGKVLASWTTGGSGEGSRSYGHHHSRYSAPHRTRYTHRYVHDFFAQSSRDRHRSRYGYKWQ